MDYYTLYLFPKPIVQLIDSFLKGPKNKIMLRLTCRRFYLILEHIPKPPETFVTYVDDIPYHPEGKKTKVKGQDLVIKGYVEEIRIRLPSDNSGSIGPNGKLIECNNLSDLCYISENKVHINVGRSEKIHRGTIVRLSPEKQEEVNAILTKHLRDIKQKYIRVVKP